MSQYPPPPPGQYPPPPGQYPPPPPVGYASAYVRPPDPRPTSVKVIAVLAIVFGSLGVLAGLCSIPQYLGVQMSPNRNPVIDAMREDKLLWDVTVATMAASVIIAAIELVSGIGALKLRPWGRRGLVVYAVTNIIVTLVGLGLQWTVFQARSDRLLAEVLRKNPQLNTPAMQTAMQVGKTTGMVFPVLFVIWASIVLLYMTRPRVKAAFEGRGGAMG
jgi:hypothetical protein